MSDEEHNIGESSDGEQLLTAEFKDGKLEIVEVTSFNKGQRSLHLPEMSSDCEDLKYVQVLDTKNTVVDLLNFTLVRSEDGDESYRLVSNTEADIEGEDTDATVTCVLANEESDAQEGQEYVMVEGINGGDEGPLMFLQSSIESPKIVNPTIKKPDVKAAFKTPSSPTEIIERAKALQKANTRVNRVSRQQLEMLWEFLNSNRDVATAYNRSLQAKEYSQRKWTEIAEFLNSQRDGMHKDWKGWTKYWVDYKAKLKAKVAAVHASHVQAGGGPSTDKSLTEIELKFLQILGGDFWQGLPGIKVEPFQEPPVISNGSITVKEEPKSPKSECIQTPQSPSPPPEPTQEALPQTPYLAPISNSTPIISKNPALPSKKCSPRRRRRRREPPMAIEIARRDFVRSSQMRAEAAVRTAEAMENMAAKIAELQNTAKNIERILMRCTEPRPRPHAKPQSIIARASTANTTVRATTTASGKVVKTHAQSSRRKGELPPPHELLASPNFKLFLYSCKMCKFKCNAIKELTAHKALEHAGGGGSSGGGGTRWRGAGRAAAGNLQCARCPFRAATHTQLMKHVQENHVEAVSTKVYLDSAEVEAADVLVCGACGYESGSREMFKRHIEDEHGATTC